MAYGKKSAPKLKKASVKAKGKTPVMMMKPMMKKSQMMMKGGK